VAAALHLVSNLGAPLAAADVLGPASLTGTAALFAVSAALAHAYGPGQRDVRLVEFEVPLPGLDPLFDGFRIVQLSDIHLGNFMDGEELAPHVERVRALDADLVCITGDICDGLHHAPATLPVLGRLRAREGVVAILGNHDVYTGADAVTEALHSWCNRERGEGDAPLVVLRNERLLVERGSARLHVLGVDDAGATWARGVREHDALEPLAASVPAGEPTVLLSHRPDLFPQAVALGIGLVLSGHTHGGPLARPWPGKRPVSLARVISDYPRGNYREGSSLLHVNLGLGVTAQPVRLFSPREITLITLRCHADAPCRAVAPRQPTGGTA
jgi:predicted MPP superfamily phosphohydrolase